MSRIVAILKIKGSILPVYNANGFNDGAAHVVIEESGGELWLRLRGEPSVGAGETVTLSNKWKGRDAITVEVETP